MRCKIDFEEIRNNAVKIANKLGYRFNLNLPLLDDSLSVRKIEEVINRTLILNVVIACSYGFNKQIGLQWLDSENLTSSLTKNELEFLTGKTNDDHIFRYQTESLWMLVWSVGKVENFDFDSYCPDTLVNLLPDLSKNESSERFRKSCELVDYETSVLFCDVAYNTHASIVHCEKNNLTILSKLEPYVIWERRRALEWLLSDDDWDFVHMDT